MIRLVLLRLLESFFRRPFLSFVPIVLFSILGFVYLTNQDPIYMANGKLKIDENVAITEISATAQGGFSWDTAAEQTVRQFDNLIQTDAFVRAVISRTDLEAQLLDPEVEEKELFAQVREDLWAAPIGDDQFGIVGRSEMPAITVQLVTAAVESFLQWNINTSLNDSTVAEDFYAEQVANFSTEFQMRQNDLREYLRLHPEPDRGDRPDIEQLEIDQLQALANDAAARWTEARDQEEAAKLISRQTESAVRLKYTLVDSPKLPEDEESSLTADAITLIIFGSLGTIISLVGIVGGALLDRTFRYPIDVRAGLELPVMGAIPPGEKFVSQHIMQLEQEEMQAAEPPQYRAKLVPNVEPPTLIIGPGEIVEREKIKQERNEYEQYAARSQERNDIHGVPDRDMAADPRAYGVREANSRPRRNGSTPRRPVDMDYRNSVRDVRNGHASDEGDSPFSRF